MRFFAKNILSKSPNFLGYFYQFLNMFFVEQK